MNPERIKFKMKRIFGRKRIGKTYLVRKTEKSVAAYPIYDWTVEDIWTYNGKFEKSYNHLYDLYYQAGMTIDQLAKLFGKDEDAVREKLAQKGIAV